MSVCLSVCLYIYIYKYIVLNLVLSLSLSHTSHWHFNMAPHGKELSEDLKKIIVALHKDGVDWAAARWPRPYNGLTGQIPLRTGLAMVDQRSWVHVLSVISRGCVWEIDIWVLPALLQSLKGWRWGISLSLLRPYGCMSAAGNGELQFIEGTNKYCDILKKSMFPSLWRLGHRAVFQHDTDHCLAKEAEGKGDRLAKHIFRPKPYWESVGHPQTVEDRKVSNIHQLRDVGSRGLMDRALDLKPEVMQGCGFKSRLWQEVSEWLRWDPCAGHWTPSNIGCPLLHLDGLNAENTFHSSLYSVLL